MAQPRLGSAFAGSDFEVRVAAPFNRTIDDGFQQVAEECVKHCPTGAMVFAEPRTSGTQVA